MTSASAFDTIFDKKVGQGSYQLIVYFFLGLVALSDEAEIISLSIILPALKKEWNLSEDQVSFLGSILFLGIFLGSIVIGLISDKLGRRTALLLASSLQFMFGIASSAVESFGIFVLIRSILGFMIGCTIPLAPTFITEISTTKYRGKGQVCIQAFFVFGMIYAMILSKIYLNDFSDGNWRALLAMGTLPSLIVFFGTLKFIKESPRFLVAQGKVERGVSVMNYMISRNSKGVFEPITREERMELINWQHMLFSYRVETVSWTALFSQENRRITCCLILNWLGLSFNFFGMVFILPLIFDSFKVEAQGQEGKGINEFFLTLLGEIPAIFISYILIDKKSFGRKNSTLFAHLMAGIMFGLAYFLEIRGLIVIMIISRIFTKMAFITINPLTSELYPTNFRTIAMGLTSGIGRLGASIMPIAIMDMYNADIFSPFLGFSVACMVMALATLLIPYEPLGRHLDNIVKNPIDELEEDNVSMEMYEQ